MAKLFHEKKVLQFDLQHSWHWHFIYSDDFFLSLLIHLILRDLDNKQCTTLAKGVLQPIKFFMIILQKRKIGYIMQHFMFHVCIRKLISKLYNCLGNSELIIFTFSESSTAGEIGGFPVLLFLRLKLLLSAEDRPEDLSILAS